MSDPKEPTIRLCQSCGFRLPYTAAPDDTLCAECRQPKGEPTIRIASCRSDGRCPECGGALYLDSVLLPCGCSACGEAPPTVPPCYDKHLRALLTEALRQRDECMDLSLRCLYRTNHPTKAGAITACCVLQAGHEDDEPHKFIEVVEEERDAAISATEHAYNLELHQVAA